MYSGKFVLRLSPEHHEKLSEEARKLNLSLNELCARKLSHKLHESSVDLSIKHILKEFEDEGLVAIALYGSQARGEAGSSSDIDVLIVLDRDPSRRLYSRWDETIAPKIDSRISPAFVHWKTNLRPIGLWLEIALDGKILWQRDRDFESYLRHLRNQIASGQFHRSLAHGQPYWTEKESR